MSEIEHLRAEVEGLRRIIARSDAKADMWQIRAEAAEARLRNVEALADEWGRFEHIGSHLWAVHAADLRAALAAEPAEVTPPAEHVCTPCWFENHKDCTGKAAKTAATPCPCDCRPTLLFGRPLTGRLPRRLAMADTPDDALIEAIARALSPLDGRVRAADARAAHAALVEHLGLTEERRCRYVAIESQFAAGLVTERRLVSKWVEVQP